MTIKEADKQYSRYCLLKDMLKETEMHIPSVAVESRYNDSYSKIMVSYDPETKGFKISSEYNGYNNGIQLSELRELILEIGEVCGWDVTIKEKD
jgi:hypothetical protein